MERKTKGKQDVFVEDDPNDRHGLGNSHPSYLDDEDAKELSPSELKRIRVIIKSQDRADWAWSTIRTWSVWIAALFGALFAGRDFVEKVINFFTGR